MVGACGIGMEGLAILLRARGCNVTGCDLAAGPAAGRLRALGITVTRGHDPSHLAHDVDRVVASTAVPDTAPELAAARARGIPVTRRGVELAELARAHRTVAVCGAHGKTTTACFLVQVLRHAGMEAGWCIGGESAALGAVARPAPAGGLLVVEADESDGTLAGYAPAVTLVTNVEFDHAEHHADLASLTGCFESVLGQTGEAAVVCADDPGAMRVAGAAPETITFGTVAGARVRAERVEQEGEGAAFDLVDAAEGFRARVVLAAPGRHNLLNALGAAAAARVCGAGWPDIAAALPACRLPGRRFECVSAAGGVRVISDYAHHPTEIAALIAAARTLRPRRLLAVFQPHRYSRTLALGPQFPAAMSGLDLLILLPVYPASELPVPGGRAWDLYARFREAGVEPPPRLVDTREAAWAYLRRVMRPEDMLLVIGAGDVEEIAQWAREAEGGGSRGCSPSMAAVEDTGRLMEGERPREPLELRTGVPLAHLTTFGVGGEAEEFAEATSEADLALRLRDCAARGIPLHILGAGSNVLVSDGGVRGTVLRLGGDAFGRIAVDGVRVRAGAAVPLARLLQVCEEHGVGGLEFLEGVPGTVGGALRMNAGAQGQAIAGRVESIRCLNPDGSLCIVRDEGLEARYRSCDALCRRVAVEAVFAGTACAPDVIRGRRAALAEGRAWLRGIRSAGSVFRNPPDEAAGRLIERAGFKGTHIGGARVSERHANVFVTGDGATASDVRALIETVRAGVAAQCGVVLETEIDLWT